MLGIRRGVFLAVAVAALLSAMGCEYFKTDEEAKLLQPPSVRTIIDDAEELGLESEYLLCRRFAASGDDLKELYEDRMDEAPGDRAIRRLERQLGRALAKLDRNYDRRLERLRDRLEEDASDTILTISDCT